MRYQIIEARGAGIAQCLLADHGDGQRDVLQRLRAFLCRDDDVFQLDSGACLRRRADSPTVG